MNGWRGAGPELAVTAGLVISLSLAAWAIGGPRTASLVVLVSVAVSLVLLHALMAREEPSGAPQPQPPQGPSAEPEPLGLEQIPLGHSFSSFWRTQGDLLSATTSLGAWDYRIRPRLANLLAARLAERHGINLAHEPQTARRLLLGANTRHDLWYWIDPRRPTPEDASDRPGIPPAALVELIERLEQL